jgi:hypothetical protein
LVEAFVWCEWSKNAAGPWRIELLEKLQVDNTNVVAIFREPVTAGFRQPFDKSLRTSFRQVVTQRSKRVFGSRTAQRFSRIRKEFSCHERIGSGDVGEAHQSMHQCQWPGMIQLQTGNPLAVRQYGGLTEHAEWVAIEERLQDVLLNIQVSVRDIEHSP